MPYQYTFTDRFRKHYKMLEVAEKRQLQKKLDILADNPAHPSLRTKLIQGTDNLHECSVNMDIRIIWHDEGETLIVLADVGHHDILRRF